MTAPIELDDTTEPATTPTRRGIPHQPGLDGIRGLAVIGVIAFHLGIAGAPQPHWLVGGWLGVSTFFTLSGFLITSLLLAEREQTGRVGLIDFWSRRVRRLLPALMVLLLATMVLARTRLVPPQPNLGRSVVSALFYVTNLVDIYAHGTEPQVPAHLWSLAIEEQFYLLFPILFLLTRRFGRWWPGVVFFSGLALASTTAATYYVHHARFDLAYSTLQGRAVELLVGVVLAFLVAHPRWRSLRDHRPVVAGTQVIGVCGFAVLALLWHRSNVLFSANRINVYTVENALATAALILAATTAGPVVVALSVRPLRWVGKVSYGAYLYHSPIFWVLTPVWLRHPAGWIVVTSRLLVLGVVCELSYRFIEAPIRRWKPSRRWHVVPAFAVPMLGLVTIALTLNFPTH